MMDLNLTLIGQMITFIGFVWFTMKFVWPPIVEVMDARQKQIADGLAAAEQGVKELELAQYRSEDILKESKAQASTIIEKANHRATHIIEEAKVRAREEGDRIALLAKSEVEQQFIAAKETLVQEVSTYAIAVAEKILQREIDKECNDDLIREVVGEL